MAEGSVNGIGVQTGLSATIGAAVSLTLPTDTLTGPPGGTRKRSPRHAVIGIEGNSVRFTIDGTAPTATVGILLPAGTIIDWTDMMADYQGAIEKAQFIGISGTATINVNYRS